MKKKVLPVIFAGIMGLSACNSNNPVTTDGENVISTLSKEVPTHLLNESDKTFSIKGEGTLRTSGRTQGLYKPSPTSLYIRDFKHLAKYEFKFTSSTNEGFIRLYKKGKDNKLKFDRFIPYKNGLNFIFNEKDFDFIELYMDLVTIRPSVYTMETKVTEAVPEKNPEPNFNNNVYHKPVNPFDQFGKTHYECTRYAWGRFAEINKKNLTFSRNYGRHGGTWFELVNNASKTTKPMKNSVIVWGATRSNPYGHVAFVEELLSDGLVISEANYSVKGRYNGRIKLTWAQVNSRSGAKALGYIF